ncbi:hypothetical protein ACTA71_004489 [Dictyostelium dimigraforme]
MTKTLNILELTSACIKLAQESGDIIRDVFKSGSLGIEMKSIDDPMTKADLLSQQHIIGSLRTIWKDIQIVGEEQCEIPIIDKQPPIDLLSNDKDCIDKCPKELKELPIEDLIIFIDPLDATREFTLGRVGCVMTLIGISFKGKPIAGIIYQPFVDCNGDGTTDQSKWVGRTIWAIVGGGIPVKGIKDRRSPEDIGKVILTTTASHFNDKVQQAVDAIKPDKLLRAGGAGYKSLLVIENQADVYVFPTVGSKLWDICGPHAILLAVGGKLTDPQGNDIIYSTDPEKIENKNGIIITISNHQKYIDLLKNFKN